MNLGMGVDTLQFLQDLSVSSLFHEEIPRNQTTLSCSQENKRGVEAFIQNSPTYELQVAAYDQDAPGGADDTRLDVGRLQFTFSFV